MSGRTEATHRDRSHKPHNYGRGARGFHETQPGRRIEYTAIHGAPKFDKMPRQASAELVAVLRQHPGFVPLLPAEKLTEFCSTFVPINGNVSLMSLITDQVLHSPWENLNNPVLKGLYKQGLRIGYLYVSFGEHLTPTGYKYIGRAGVMRRFKTGQRIFFLNDGVLKSAKFVGVNEFDRDLKESWIEQTRKLNWEYCPDRTQGEVDLNTERAMHVLDHLDQH